MHILFLIIIYKNYNNYYKCSITQKGGREEERGRETERERERELK